MFENLDSFHCQIPVDGIRVYSFDIFDTVLTRATATADGIFILMREKISAPRMTLPDDFYRNFHTIRSKAGRQARRELNKECNLTDIYGFLQRRYNLAAEDVKALQHLEMQLELECVRPIAPVIRVLETLHRHQRRVIYITDMYLPRQNVVQMLAKAGAPVGADNLYISHEYDKTKKHGDLYPAVLKKERCIARQVLHIGDNLRADGKSARKNGLKTFLYRQSRINRYEKILLKSERAGSTAVGQKLSGASKQARLAYPAGFSKHSLTLYRIGANVAGPVLLLFVRWILQEAQRNKLQRLYFLARDGQILLQIARKIQKYTDYQGELRYLYGSRQALYLPAAKGLNKTICSWILLKKQYLTLTMIANRTGLDVKMLQQELEGLSGNHYDADHQFNNKDLNLLQDLLNASNVKNTLMANAAHWREGARDYFTQEGLFEDTPYGVVDLGVKGTLQDCIKDILLHYSPDRRHELYGFYFGVNRFAKVSGRYKKKFGYLFAPNRRYIHCPVSFSATRILEIFTTGDHGLTLSYRSTSAGWGPRLKEKVNTDIVQWGLADLRLGVRAFIDAFRSFGAESVETIDPVELQNSVTMLLSTLANQPTKDEAQAIGDHPFKNDPVESYTVTFAPEFTLRLARMYLKNWRNSEITSWLEGTCARSPLTVRCFLEPLRLFNRSREAARKGISLYSSRRPMAGAPNTNDLPGRSPLSVDADR